MSDGPTPPASPPPAASIPAPTSAPGTDLAGEPRANPRPVPRFVELPDPEWAPRLRRADRPRPPRRPRPARRTVILLVAIALLCLLFGGYAISRSTALDVDRITVSGADRTSPDAIVAASGISVHDAMTDVDAARARRAIRALPWIDTVSVRRHWPGTVAVTVTERVPLASVKATDALVLVDRTGRVLDQIAKPAADLVLVEIADGAAAPGTVQPKLSPLLAVAAQLTPDLRAWVTKVSRSPEGSPLLFLKDGVTVVLGDAANVTEKLIDLTTVLARVDLKDLCRIDVSVVHNPAVARNPNCTQ